MITEEEKAYLHKQFPDIARQSKKTGKWEVKERDLRTGKVKVHEFLTSNEAHRFNLAEAKKVKKIKEK